LQEGRGAGKRNAENVGTKGTKKVPAQEDDEEGDGGQRGGSPSTLLALAIPGYTRRPYTIPTSVGSYGLCDGETKEGGGTEAVHRLFNTTFTGERASRRSMSRVRAG